MMKAAGPGVAEDLEPLSDEDLLGRYRDFAAPGDFNELVRRYERELYRYLARYLGNPALAEDVFQNTFLQVHLKRALYEDGRPVRPWFYAIATHQAVDALRKAGRHPTVSLDRRVTNSGESDPGSLVDLLVGDGTVPLDSLAGAGASRLGHEERREVARGPPPDPHPGLSPGFEIPRDRRGPQDPRGYGQVETPRRLAKLQEMARTSRQDGND